MAVIVRVISVTLLAIQLGGGTVQPEGAGSADYAQRDQGLQDAHCDALGGCGSKPEPQFTAATLIELRETHVTQKVQGCMSTGAF